MRKDAQRLLRVLAEMSSYGLPDSIRAMSLVCKDGAQLHPVVEPQVSHFRQVPFRTRVKLAHSGQASPT
jgi:hypothetical protein